MPAEAVMAYPGLKLIIHGGHHIVKVLLNFFPCQQVMGAVANAGNIERLDVGLLRR